MSLADVGDEAVGWFGVGAIACDFAPVVGSHLNHGKVVLAGAQAQQRERHPDVVVQVADGGQHPELLGQHGREQLLGGGFAVRARDGQHRNSELLAVLPGQLLQRQ